jgi:thiamine kinase-like enzyme
MIEVKENCFIDRENRLFIKHFPKQQFNQAGIDYQQYLFHHKPQHIQIAEVVGVIENDVQITVTYKLYDGGEAKPADANIITIAQALAELHRIGSNHSLIPTAKKKSYDFTNYTDLSILDEADRNARIHMLDTLKDVTSDTFVIAHRDFRLKNILETQDGLVLIDFDFTAIDLAAIEIGSILTDLLMTRGKEGVQLFINEYKDAAAGTAHEADIALPLYLKYLLQSTFPYDKRDQYSLTRFNELAEDRKSRIEALRVYLRA